MAPKGCNKPLPREVRLALILVRQGRGLSQRGLERLTGLPQRRICNLERGLAAPQWWELRELCLALNLSADALLQLPHAETSPSPSLGSNIC